jgi:hypothetical protein
MLMSERQQQQNGPGAPLRHWLAGDWLDDDALRPLAEINAHCIQLLREQALHAGLPRAPSAVLVELRELWMGLDAGGCGRLAACPYALVDAGFADAQRWREVQQGAVHDLPRPTGVVCFDAAAVQPLLRRVLIYGWYLARAHRQLARIVFGMTPATAQAIAALSLQDLDRIAERHGPWLRPRWEGRPQIWRQLLACAGATDEGAMQQATLHGLQLMAGGALAGHEARA